MPRVVGSFPSATATTPKNATKSKKGNESISFPCLPPRTPRPRPFALKFERNATQPFARTIRAREAHLLGKSSTFSAAARNFCLRCQQHGQMHGAGICSGFASCSRQVLCVDFGFQFQNGVTWNWFLYKHAHTQTHTHANADRNGYIWCRARVCVCVRALCRARVRKIYAPLCMRRHSSTNEWLLLAGIFVLSLFLFRVERCCCGCLPVGCM